MIFNETETFIFNGLFSGKLKISECSDGLEILLLGDDGIYSKVGEISRKIIVSKTMYKPRWVRWGIEIAQRQKKVALTAKESK